ncbi:hypothetical protein MVLG_06852 [Microbotryum lychnidis-dioicae p1A1 Lamole]|uniref:3-oxoacyl-[acyl-carrier protein] reductase n=1 Tax=Microbotryum lychnidis-dioicae (strain p1A1 Lamole / MvSl-1064) TaxID=683840 RepID=U5HIK0_USTV1|nr:hypothetical protein MVLG_06852 [Microbotryum lychnidis-dioicae p1A1 Lamole]|eukprot:KDE02601.1 hypothetical protein MVLG_06852 [Microbotryum lychnidis-dioicae p1A1 Lamole]
MGFGCEARIAGEVYTLEVTIGPIQTLHLARGRQFFKCLDRGMTVATVKAPFRIVREAAPYLRAKDPKVIATNRAIVNISSIAGLHGNVGQTNYATAKSGILGFTKTVAKEWGAFNVRCNAVAFGYILSRLTQAKELGETIEVAGQNISLGIPTGGKKQEGPVPGIPLGRPGTAQEAANGVLFLISPLASYAMGHTLEVTAGNGI